MRRGGEGEVREKMCEEWRQERRQERCEWRGALTLRGDSYLMHIILKYKVAIIVGSCFLHIL